MSWCDWCWKHLHLDPRNGGCPCPRSREEWEQRQRVVEERHQISVLRASGSASDWLRMSKFWGRAHLFEGSAIASRCRLVTRGMGAVVARPTDRRCQLCQSYDEGDRK